MRRNSPVRDVRKTLARSAAAAFAIGLAGVGSSSAASAAELVSSPLILAAPAETPASVVCHFSNIGGQTVRVTGRKLFRQDGSNVPLTANSCGGPDGFNLGPRSACTISGAAVGNVGYGCKGGVGSAGAVRASIEMRDASPKVVRSALVAVGVGGTSATDFQTISSPALFGAPNQSRAFCQIANAGATSARLKNYEIRSSTGAVVPSRLEGCAGAPEATIPPGKSCVVTNISPTPALDLQCRVAVTRKANIRGAFYLLSDTEVLNWKPVR